MLFIKGNFPSFKNSKQFTRNGFVVMSKVVKKYLKLHEAQWGNEDTIKEFHSLIKDLEKPYMIGIHFIRGTRHRYDWINMCQGVQDLMVKYGWIDDDNVAEMFPVPLEVDGVFTQYSKEEPGVWIKVIR